jgi:hypothetical protein
MVVDEKMSTEEKRTWLWKTMRLAGGTSRKGRLATFRTAAPDPHIAKLQVNTSCFRL